MKTWDEMKFLYYGIAKRYMKAHPEFEIDELVNVAFIMTYPFINDVTYNKLPHRIHQVISNYIHSNIQRYRLAGVYHRLYFGSLDDVENCFVINNHELNMVDIQDIIAEKAIKLKKDEKVLLYMKFELGMNNCEIGRLTDYTGERIRQKLKTIYEKMSA